MQRFLSVLVLIALSASAQEFGRPSDPGLTATDLFSTFKLPPLRDSAGSAVEKVVSGLQVGKRAQLLGVTGNSATDAWMSAEKLIAIHSGQIAPRAVLSTGDATFSGSTASALNRFMAQSGAGRFKVTSAAMTVDQPIEIQTSGVTLDLGGAQLTSSATGYMLRIERASNVSVLHGDFTAGDSAVLVNASNAVSVSGLRISGLSGAGVVVTGSDHVVVSDNRISGMGLAAVMLGRGSFQCIVQGNQIAGGAGFGNLMAGIALTDREADLAFDPRAIFEPNGYWVLEQPMLQRTHPPHDNAIAGNQITRNNSSGIYIDGAVRNVIASNMISSNAKEGLCLDNGATANVVVSNVLEANGDRWGEPDRILALEFILGGGRLPDGTPAEKVPGISIDNALYNIVFSNTVTHNFGGGIKMVRTGFFNLIGLNTLFSDNDGESDGQHFFGIELGAAAGDAASPELDFTPSSGNIVFSNNIRGNHYSGIFFDWGSDQNDVLNNLVFDASKWALESVQQMQNDSVNNLTNLPSRNIGAGLDSALVVSGQPVNDPPPM